MGNHCAETDVFRLRRCFTQILAAQLDSALSISSGLGMRCPRKGEKMDAIITLRKQEICQVLIRNVPEDHTRPLQDWYKLAMSAVGKDWEEDDIEVDSFSPVNPGSDDLPSVEFKPVE